MGWFVVLAELFFRPLEQVHRLIYSEKHLGQTSDW